MSLSPLESRPLPHVPGSLAMKISYAVMYGTEGDDAHPSSIPVRAGDGSPISTFHDRLPITASAM
jgi:hypothetical protein